VDTSLPQYGAIATTRLSPIGACGTGKLGNVGVRRFRGVVRGFEQAALGIAGEGQHRLPGQRILGAQMSASAVEHKAAGALPQALEEGLPILVIEKYPVPRVATRHHLVNSIIELDSQRARHVATLNHNNRCFNTRPDPKLFLTPTAADSRIFVTVPDGVLPLVNSDARRFGIEELP